MYYNDNVAGTGGRRVNRANCITSEEFCRRRCNEDNVAPDLGRRRCDFVFECLLELLEEAVENNNERRNCDFVFECLEDLLEDAVEDNNDFKFKCRKHC